MHMSDNTELCLLNATLLITQWYYPWAHHTPHWHWPLEYPVYCPLLLSLIPILYIQIRKEAHLILLTVWNYLLMTHTCLQGDQALKRLQKNWLYIAITFYTTLPLYVDIYTIWICFIINYICDNEQWNFCSIYVTPEPNSPFFSITYTNIFYSIRLCSLIFKY